MLAFSIESSSHAGIEGHTTFSTKKRHFQMMYKHICKRSGGGDKHENGNGLSFINGTILILLSTRAIYFILCCIFN